MTAPSKDRRPASSSRSGRLILGPQPQREREGVDQEMARLMGETSDDVGLGSLAGVFSGDIDIAEGGEDSGTPPPIEPKTKTDLPMEVESLSSSVDVPRDELSFVDEPSVPVAQPTRSPWSVVAVLIIGILGIGVAVWTLAGTTTEGRTLQSAKVMPRFDPETSGKTRSENNDGSGLVASIKTSPKPKSKLNAETVVPSPAEHSQPPRGPRDPTPQMPPEQAAALAKLPVASTDRPPVGGVGASGIHVDRVAIGSSSARSRCQDPKPQYSIAARDRVNLCFRVVHPRDVERVTVQWEKDDSKTVRRSWLQINDTHAYRTRAYLVLRSEYVGPWTVRVLADDGVELAKQHFVVEE